VDGKPDHVSHREAVNIHDDVQPDLQAVAGEYEGEGTLQQLGLLRLGCHPLSALR